MGAPVSSTKSADQPAAETLLTAFKTINATERRKHASVLNYWLSIRGDKEFPPLHDLDPLELSDAGPNSILLELISGGHDAEIRHLGEGLVGEEKVERIIDAPSPSILSCIAQKLPIVAISRDFLAFEDEFSTDDGPTRCWVTLLPLSAGGAWVDYVYALVSADSPTAKAAAKKSKKVEPEPEEVEEPVAEEAEEPEAEEVEEPVTEAVDEPEAVADEPVDVVEDEEPEQPVSSAVSKAAPGFSKLFDSLAGLTGFYGSQPVKVEPVVEEAEEQPIEEEPVEEPVAEEVEEPVAETIEEPVAEEIEEPVAEEIEEPVAEEPAEKVPVAEELVAEEPAKKSKPASASEGTLQKKLTEVRAKTDEARLAKIRANAALYEGLSAAYDFALDAEEAPEDYLRLVEAQGLKIQLRSPMKPVVKLAFEGMCDDATIKQLEAVLAWAFDQELPRGTLAERIEEAGGVGRILNEEKKAA
jgi:outer membrane biosynthesis protein TonB